MIREKPTIMITGATGSLGSALVDELAKISGELWVSGRNGQRLAELKRIYEGQCKIEYGAFDVRKIPSESHLSYFFDLAGHKNLDVLVNNAGVGRFGPLEALSDESVAEMIETNLTSLILLSKEAYRIMKQNGKGLIVNIASTAGLRGFPYQSVYSASKYGVVGFSQALNEEGRKHGVRVVCVCPAGIDNEFWAKAGKDASAAGFLKNEDVARGVVQLIQLPAAITPELIVYRAPTDNYMAIRDLNGKRV